MSSFGLTWVSLGGQCKILPSSTVGSVRLIFWPADHHGSRKSHVGQRAKGSLGCEADEPELPIEKVGEMLRRCVTDGKAT